MQILCIYFILLCLSLASPALGSFITGPDQLKDSGAKFSWTEVKSKSLRIFIEYKGADGKWKRANLGSGFLISPDGLFVTAYHVMKHCLEGQKESRFSVAVDCTTAHPRIRYKAQNGDKEYDILILSHLKETESTNGKARHTPDEIIKNRDFVIGRLKAVPKVKFLYWELGDYRESAINLSDPHADFTLQPLLPPKKVFIAGYPLDRDFELTDGFLNLTDGTRRGYFAADFEVYTPAYLQREGISPDTKWGMAVENHMSGGAVIDASGHLVGLVVNGNKSTAGVLAIENVLETFFSRAGKAGTTPSIILTPNKTPLYLIQGPTP